MPGGRGRGLGCACASEPEPREEAGAVEAAEGAGRVRRHVRSQRPLLPPSPTESLAPKLEEAPPEPATARGCASRSSNSSRPRCCPPPSPSPGSRRRPRPRRCVSRAGRAGGAVPASCPPLSPSSVSSSVLHRLGPGFPEPSLLGGTERERGRGGTMLGADEGSLAGLFFFTCPGLPSGGL